jgi:tyrosine-protein kinase Etk/Wzc
MFNPQVDSQNNQLKDITEKFNSGFDVGLLAFLIFRNKLLILLFFVSAFAIAFIYLRYSQPLYESHATLQINDNNTANNILNFNDLGESGNSLAEAIEQIKSKAFLKRVVEKLDISINYFSEGTFKNNELYQASPFLVKVNLKDQNLYGQNIYVEFSSDLKGGKLITPGASYAFETNKWLTGTPFDIIVYLNRSLKESQIRNIIKANKAVYFTISDTDRETAELQLGLEVRLINESAKTIRISMKDVNSKKATDIVNAITEEYLSYDVERKSESSTAIISFIDSQLGNVYNELKTTEGDLQKFKQAKKIGEQEKLVTSDMMRYSSIEDQMLKIQVEEKLIGELQASLQKSQNVDVYQLVSMISGTDYEVIVKDITQTIQRLLAEKENLLWQHTPNSKTIEHVNFQLDTQKKLLLETLDAIRLKYKTKYKNLAEQTTNFKSRMATSPEDEVEFSRLSRLYSISEKYYTMLLEKKTEFSISKAGYVSQNIILEKALGQGTLVSPNKRRAIVIALVCSLLMAFLLVFIKYLFHDKIYSLADITRFSSGNIGLLGVIPKYPHDIPVSQLIVDKNPKGLISEAFRTVRTNLSFIDNSEGTKILSITSTISGEGKTFVAINIAGVLAFTGKKVVIIDLDLRKPKIHKGFGVSNNVGMSTILTGNTSVDECFQNSPMTNLQFITAGPSPPNPSELIMGEKLNEVMDYLKLKFDYIVIDNAPIGLVTDGITTFQKANYPIYVFRAGYSRKQFAQILDRLKVESGIKNLSVILNDVDLTRKIYSYSYGYRYGYGYGYGSGYYSDDIKRSRKKYFRG